MSERDLNWVSCDYMTDDSRPTERSPRSATTVRDRRTPTPPRQRMAAASAPRRRAAARAARPSAPGRCCSAARCSWRSLIGQWVWVVAILGLALLITVHEFGHFIAAKAFGMRVEKFYVGFPPAALRRTWGETEYGIGIIPLGGFCKISGMTARGGGPRGHRRPRLLQEGDLEAQRHHLRRPAR